MKLHEHNKKLYNKVICDDYHLSHELKINKIISLINNKPKKILDVGCGDGWVGRILKDKYKADVHGVDIAKKLLKKANGIKTKAFNLEEKKWPYKGNYFDLIIAGDIIEHIYDTENFAREAYRILKKKGIIIISTPNINSYYNRLLMLFGKMPLWVESAPNIVFSKFAPPCGHVRAFNKYTLTKLLELQGFKIKEVKGAGFRILKRLVPEEYKIFAGIYQKIENFFGRFSSLASFNIVKGIK